MFSSTLIALAIASGALAAPTPTTPSGSFTAQGECNIAWLADTNATKPWNTMNIQLMTGSNAQMTHMRTVATVDATKQTNFSWTCPEVDPYSIIYFYQFSSPVDPSNLLWVTRFLIQAEDGSSVPPPMKDANGVPWGVGTFVDPSLYNAMPSYLAGNGQLQGVPGNGTTPGSTVVVTSTTTGSVSFSTPTGSSTGSGASTRTGTITTVTTTTTSSAETSTTTNSTGGALSSVSSSSWMTLLSAIVAGVIALST